MIEQLYSVEFVASLVGRLVSQSFS